ncbi:hypothetical protein BC567DRAFT_246891 [Phyllosticta citribraziliensis]
MLACYQHLHVPPHGDKELCLAVSKFQEDSRTTKLCDNTLATPFGGQTRVFVVCEHLTFTMNLTMRLTFWDTVNRLLKKSPWTTISKSQVPPFLACSNKRLSPIRTYDKEIQSALSKHCRTSPAMSIEDLRHNRLQYTISLILGEKRAFITQK